MPSAETAPMIEVAGLTKHYQVHKRPPGLLAAVRSLFHRTYETKRAVEDLSFRIAAGERVGFLGPNGAGKTTTLKMLSGLLYPTGGTLRVAGHVPQRRETRFLQQITLVMGQKQQLMWDLPPADTFLLNQAVYDLPRAEYEETLAELDQLLDLSSVSKVPTRQLSLGERMKCELAAALLHRPKVLFLDEPTIGLDVSMQETLRRFVKEYNRRSSATVILTSHYMDDVAALCPRVIVIDHGRLRYDGDLQELVRTLRPDKQVTMRFLRPVPAESLRGLPVAVLKSDEMQAVVQVPKESLRDVVAHLLGQLPVADLTVEDPPLEEVMRDLFNAPINAPVNGTVGGTAAAAGAGASAAAGPGSAG